MNARKRYLNMSINALIGYIIVETFSFAAHYLGLSSISYADIIKLSIAVNTGTVFFIVLLYRVKKPGRILARAVFICEFLLFISMYSIFVYKLKELRNIAPVFAIVAVAIILPFARFAESMSISISTIVAQIIVSFIALKDTTSGIFIREFYYSISTLPILIIISFVAHQITSQRRTIESDKRSLSVMNSHLKDVNKRLELANTLSENELKLASEVQKNILPSLPDTRRYWDIAVSYRPKYGISGDFYDFYYRENSLQGIALFDVSGHGVSSALITMMIKPIAFRLFNSMRGKGLDKLITELNKHISREINNLDTFITCIIARFTGDSVECVNAGHPDPLHRCHKTGNVRLLNEEGRIIRAEPIGINLSSPTPTVLRFNIKKGDMLLFYSDGIIDSPDRTMDRFGFERLTGALKEAEGGSAGDVLDNIMENFFAFADEKGINDDITLVLVKKNF